MPLPPLLIDSSLSFTLSSMSLRKKRFQTLSNLGEFSLVISTYLPWRGTFGASLCQGFRGLVPPNALLRSLGLLQSNLAVSLFLHHTGHGEGCLGRPSIKGLEVWCLQMLYL